MKNNSVSSILVAGILFVLLAYLLLVCSLPVISAVDEENITSVQEARECLEESTAVVNELLVEGFNIERANGTLAQAQAFYDDTIAKRKKDFSMVVSLCDSIKELEELAHNSLIEFSALKEFYNDSITSDMNTTDVNKIIAEIGEEIANERYEKVEALVDRGYEAVINLRASYGALEVLKRNTRNFIIRFFAENWKPKLIIFSILVLLFFLLRKRMMVAFILRKIEKLEIRRNTLKELIRQTQKDYFEYGKLPEGTYNIRTKKFAELIRDIDRQTPLLKEELAKLEMHKKAESSILRGRHSEESRKEESAEEPKRAGQGAEKRAGHRILNKLRKRLKK